MTYLTTCVINVFKDNLLLFYILTLTLLNHLRFMQYYLRYFHIRLTARCTLSIKKCCPMTRFSSSKRKLVRLV